ncbi:MAG: hypothetical protein MZV64_13190 [Ignavibacteriales bacterium]|nr:hypothetical protein [Ignavibacteriales bacterium]
MRPTSSGSRSAQNAKIRVDALPGHGLHRQGHRDRQLRPPAVDGPLLDPGVEGFQGRRHARRSVPQAQARPVRLGRHRRGRAEAGPGRAHLRPRPPGQAADGQDRPGRGQGGGGRLRRRERAGQVRPGEQGHHRRHDDRDRLRPPGRPVPRHRALRLPARAQGRRPDQDGDEEGRTGQMSGAEPVIFAEDLWRIYELDEQKVEALRGVSLDGRAGRVRRPSWARPARASRP